VLLGLALAVQAHDPDLTPAEAVGNPAGLAGIEFRGPVGTPIEKTPCEPIPDADKAMYSDGGTAGGHMGHISQVVATKPTAPGSSFILPASVDLWHFYDSTYNNPSQIEGPSPSQGVMLGTDGFFRGEMSEDVLDGTGIDMQVTDVHDTRTYCLYGGLVKEGPFFFIDSTYRDPVKITMTDLDLNIFYAPLFMTEYPGEPVRLRFFFPVASVYDDPGLVVDFVHTNLDAPLNLTLDPGVRFEDKSSLPRGVLAIGTTTYRWEFGDGAIASGVGAAARVANHEYADDGVYTSCLRVTTKEGDTDRVCQPVKINNRPPVAFFECPVVVRGTVSQFADSSTDRDGTIDAWLWGFGDGTSDTVAAAEHQYDATDDYAITLTVWDDDGASDTRGRTCPAPGPPNRPPVIDPIPTYNVPAGTEVSFTVTAYDPDGDTVTLRAVGLPPGATFDPLTGVFRWKADRAGYFPDIMFEARDPSGLVDNGGTDVRVYAPSIDSDNDGVQDGADNCAGATNLDQGDDDRDGQGDGCSASAAHDGSGPADPSGHALSASLDTDGDTHADSADNCPQVANRDQADRDRDGLGDMCDADEDGDGVATDAGSYIDNCPALANPDQADADRDGRGDACDELAADGGRDAGGARLPAAGLAPESAAGALVAAVGWALGGALAILLAGIGLAFLLRRQNQEQGPGNP
jgi:hypothetical protein